MKSINLEKMKFPQIVGPAEIRITKTYPPFCRGNKIFLSDGPSPEFFWLANKTQFLFRVYDTHKAYETGKDIWWGGIDESGADKNITFLTRMRHEAYKILMEKGEKGFFKALMPIIIREWQRRFGYLELQRQGDIWAIPIGMSFEELCKVFFIVNGKEVILERVKDRIFGTRHKINGSWLRRYREANIYFIETDIGPDCFMVCQGVLSSPTHKPIKLDGLHILAQTNLLHSLRGAD